MHKNSYFDTENNRHKSFELPGARPHYNPDRPGQVEHIFLDLALDIASKNYCGTCHIHLNPVRDGVTLLTLDAVGLYIASVQISEIAQPFEYDGEQLHVYLTEATQTGKPIVLSIAYSVEQPQRGLYFITPTADYPHKPTQVWTQGEDEDSRYWFPCFDYPGQLATSEIRVRVPKPFLAISNGVLVETQEDGDAKIYHWRQEQVHPSYLMALAVGDFIELQDEWQGIPVTYYVEKGREADARRTMGKTPEMLEFFSKTFGYRYPYPKYAQVCVEDFIFGGMENTSTTLLTDRCLLDERAALDNRAAENLVAHELAHQWFGDLVVIKHWSHAWIKEGMATYSEVMWTENQLGAEEAAYYRLNEARNYLAEDASRYRRPMVTHVYREAIELYDRHLYEKGACVYHMIRAELGDELFFKTIHTFVQDHAHKTVETVDLLRAIDKATGRNLQFLFDQYVFRGGHPDYKVAYSWDGDSHLAKLTITQTQAKDGDKSSNSGLFDLKIAIGFGYITQPETQTGIQSEPQVGTQSGTSTGEEPPRFFHHKTFTVRVHEREQTFYFPLERKPNFIRFDIGNPILKTVTLEYPVSELTAQLQHDPDPISRTYAAEALAKKGGLEAVKALSAALQQESFWGVRAEVAKQLASIKLDQAVEGLNAGLTDEHPKVRRAVVDGLAKLKLQSSYEALKSIAQGGDPSYYVESSAIAGLGTVAAVQLDESLEADVLTLMKSILQERSGWNETVRSGAISGLSKLKTSEAALEMIFEYTAAGTPQALRLSAIRALGAISSGQSKSNLQRILNRLDDLSREPFFLIQVSVVSALGQMETPKAIGRLNAIADQTPDGRVRRAAEEAMQRVQKAIGKDQAVKKVQEELDQLKKDNQELRSRLESLEAKAKLNSGNDAK
jgi:aminopeptidase N